MNLLGSVALSSRNMRGNYGWGSVYLTCYAGGDKVSLMFGGTVTSHLMPLVAHLLDVGLPF
jgi:hypothetical protein